MSVGTYVTHEGSFEGCPLVPRYRRRRRLRGFVDSVNRQQQSPSTLRRCRSTAQPIDVAMPSLLLSWRFRPFAGFFSTGFRWWAYPSSAKVACGPAWTLPTPVFRHRYSAASRVLSTLLSERFILVSELWTTSDAHAKTARLFAHLLNPLASPYVPICFFPLCEWHSIERLAETKRSIAKSIRLSLHAKFRLIACSWLPTEILAASASIGFAP